MYEALLWAALLLSLAINLVLAGLWVGSRAKARSLWVDGRGIIRHHLNGTKLLLAQLEPQLSGVEKTAAPLVEQMDAHLAYWWDNEVHR